MQNKYFKGKRILITGISGFIGSALEKKLLSFGADVYGISRSKEATSKILNATILDYKKLEEFVVKSKIEVIFHLAGESLVEVGQESPYATFMTNIQGTINVLEIARISKIDRVIVASTSHVYGRNKVPYYEGYMPRPTRPYETSKASIDLIAQSYADTFGLPVLIPRFVNIYGPGDLNFTRLIPKTIRAVLSHQNPQMWGGNAIREYLFLDDAVNAYVLLASVDLKKVGSNKIFNFGSGTTVSVKELMEKIISLSKESVQITKIDDKREHEINIQYVSSKKAKNLLLWEPKTNLEEGLLKSIAWYKELLYNKVSF